MKTSQHHSSSICSKLAIYYAYDSWFIYDPSTSVLLVLILFVAPPSWWSHFHDRSSPSSAPALPMLYHDLYSSPSIHPSNSTTSTKRQNQMQRSTTLELIFCCCFIVCPIDTTFVSLTSLFSMLSTPSSALLFSFPGNMMVRKAYDTGMFCCEEDICTYICFPPKINLCCTGGIPSFSSTFSLICETCYKYIFISTWPLPIDSVICVFWYGKRQIGEEDEAEERMLSWGVVRGIGGGVDRWVDCLRMYLVIRLDIKLDFFAGEGTNSTKYISMLYLHLRLL